MYGAALTLTKGCSNIVKCASITPEKSNCAYPLVVISLYRIWQHLPTCQI